MPSSAPKPCRRPGCGALVRGGGNWCEKHKPAVRPGSFADPARGTRHERGYDSEWDKLRKRILSRDKGLCQVCLSAGRYRPARIVDHIINKAAGGSDDPSNLRAICKTCHDAKTAREALAGRGG